MHEDDTALVTGSIQRFWQPFQSFSQRLPTLARDCAFSEVTAEDHKGEALRDAFISGFKSSNIRLRVLEHEDLKLEKAIQIADSLERAHSFSSSYESSAPSGHLVSSIQQSNQAPDPEINQPTVLTHAVLAPSSKGDRKPRGSGSQLAKTCIYCGNFHDRSRKHCPAKDSNCHLCGRKGHFAKVCRSRAHPSSSIAAVFASSRLASVPRSLKSSSITVSIGKRVIEALVDSGATENYMNQSLFDSLGLTLRGHKSTITLASTDSVTNVLGFVKTTLKINGRCYKNVKFGVVYNLCADIILGLDFLQKHRRVIFQFHGQVNDLGINDEHCSVSAAKVKKMP